MSSVTNTSSTGASGTASRMPVIFLAHGAPPLLDDEEWKGELHVWARAMPKPRAVLMVSAHWEDRPTTIGATATVPLVYDFYGFPRHYYETKYPAPGAPLLAARVRDLLDAKGLSHAEDPQRGLDHGAFVPMLAMYPEADVPTLQVSMPGLDPKDLIAFGRALAPLADEGVLIVGSGFLTHNLRDGMRTASTPAWASEFDAWTKEALERRDLDELADFLNRAPSARLAHPRSEHYAPVIVSAAAAEKRDGKPTFPISGYWNLAPAFTRRSVQFG